MTHEALDVALARLERAIERIERATGARDATARERAARYALLERRHGLLRDRVQDTVRRLDALIAGGGD